MTRFHTLILVLMLFISPTKNINANRLNNSYLSEYFNITYQYLKVYNPNIDSITVYKIVNTAYMFSLTDSVDIFKLGIGQLLVESGGSHTIITGKKFGKLIISSGGAIGISQVTPTTAFGYLSSLASTNDLKILDFLGCSDLSFVLNDNLSKSTKILKTKEWLKNETNNIAIWGLIMSYNLNNYNNINKALVAYNMGFGGLNTWIKNGGRIQKHRYIISIKQKIKYAEEQINS